MLKMFLELDADKIEREGKYDLDKINAYLDKETKSRGIYKDKTGFYVGGSFAAFGGLILLLAEDAWFLDNVKEWKWYNSDGQKNPEDFGVEDIAQFFRNKKKMAG